MCYNAHMLKKRKRRCDTTHLVYVITNTYTGEQYIGITVKNPGGIFKTLKRRIQKHVQRAMAEDKSWALSESIRTWGSEAFSYGFVESIRGRKNAHQRERHLITQYSPVLNTF